MPSLNEHQADQFTKLLYIGDSGTGKTGSLVSLIQDGYSLRIIDMDNGLEPLVQFARKNQCDLSKVEYETFRNKYKAGPGGVTVRGQPKAFLNAMDKLTEWSEIEDPKCVVVIDSLSSLGTAAFEWARGMNPTAKEPRTWYFSAQQGIESTLALLTSDDFKMNVIVISHISYDDFTETGRKGYARSIGSALNSKIANYFNTLILAESSGSGTNVRRRIKTMPTGVIDLKIPLPEVDKEYPLETGLSTIFSKLKGI